MKKFTKLLCIILALVVCGVVALHTTSNKTVDDVISRTSVPYFIVKEVDTLAVLNEDVYMDREVVEINICDDTLCLFIDLAESETQRVREV